MKKVKSFNKGLEIQFATDKLKLYADISLGLLKEITVGFTMLVSGVFGQVNGYPVLSAIVRGLLSLAQG